MFQSVKEIAHMQGETGSHLWVRGGSPEKVAIHPVFCSRGSHADRGALVYIDHSRGRVYIDMTEYHAALA